MDPTSLQCANCPESNYSGLTNYFCPLWLRGGDGTLDESGSEIDPELSKTLCISCYTVKTKRSQHTLNIIRNEYNALHTMTFDKLRQVAISLNILPNGIRKKLIDNIMREMYGNEYLLVVQNV